LRGFDRFHCNIRLDDGLWCADYVEQVRFLLFREITKDLEAALENFVTIADGLKK
jgi:hypothetical protein